MAESSQEFKQLNSFFEKASLPPTLKLDSGTFIPDVPLLFKNNLDSLRSREMNDVASPDRYYRLNLLKSYWCP